MKKILLLEDDEVKAKDIKMFIEQERHYDLRHETSINAGLRALHDNFDCVLLDMSLPRFSENSLKNFEPFGGIKVIREIERKKINVEIIVITQYSIFGEGSLKKTLEEIKKQCFEYNVNFKDAIKYSRDSDTWKEELKNYL